MSVVVVVVGPLEAPSAAGGGAPPDGSESLFLPGGRGWGLISELDVIEGWHKDICKALGNGASTEERH